MLANLRDRLSRFIPESELSRLNRDPRAEVPATPLLRANRLTFRNSEGRTLTVEFPRSSYAQLQDNREWGWKIFDWWFAIPYDRNARTYRVKIGVGRPGRPGEDRDQVADHVLSPFLPEEHDAVAQACDEAADQVMKLVEGR